MFFKIDGLKNFTVFTGKHMCWSHFLINLKEIKRLEHKCFPVNIEKYLRTVFFYRTPLMATSEKLEEPSSIYFL